MNAIYYKQTIAGWFSFNRLFAAAPQHVSLKNEY